MAGIFTVRDTLRVARGCFGGRKVKDLWCMPCVACEGVRALYGGVQNWDCAGELQGESRLLKLAFKHMFGAAAGVIYPQTTPRLPLGGSQLEQDETWSKLEMKQYAVRDPSHALSHSFSHLVKKKKEFFFSLVSGKWEDYLPSFKSVHRTRKLFPCLILPSGLMPFCLENGLKKHRVNLHHALCKNLYMHYIQLLE